MTEVVAKKRSFKNDRNKLIDGFSPELKDLFFKIVEIFEKDSIDAIENRYQLGLIVREISANTTGAYGSNSIERLSKAVSLKPAALYTAKKFVEIYNREVFKELTSVTNIDGVLPSWEHIEALVHIPDDQVRKQMYEAVLEECLTPKELIKRIKAHFAGSAPSKRKPNKPTTFAGYLDSIIATSEAFIKKAETLWCGGDKPLAEIAKEITEVSNATLDKVQTTMDKLAETFGTMQEAAKTLEEIREELMLKAHPEDDDEDDENDDDCDDEDDEDDEDDDYEDEDDEDDDHTTLDDIAPLAKDDPMVDSRLYEDDKAAATEPAVKPKRGRPKKVQAVTPAAPAAPKALKMPSRPGRPPKVSV